MFKKSSRKQSPASTRAGGSRTGTLSRQFLASGGNRPEAAVGLETCDSCCLSVCGCSHRRDEAMAHSVAVARAGAKYQARWRNNIASTTRSELAATMPAIAGVSNSSQYFKMMFRYQGMATKGNRNNPVPIWLGTSATSAIKRTRFTCNTAEGIWEVAYGAKRRE